MIKHCGYTNFWVTSGWIALIVLLFVLLPEPVSAQTTFRSIVDIPGISDDAEVTNNFGLYINALYIFAITVGAMLAVLKLVAAGVKYMFSDIVTNKEAAKSDIKGALLGLLIVIGAVVVLNTVNTDLTRVDLVFEPVDVDTRDYMREALERIRDLIAACEADDDCVITVMTPETCLSSSVNGRVISGNALLRAGGGNFWNRCAHISRGPTTCPNGERPVRTLIPGGIERSCVSVDDIEPTDTPISVSDCIEGDPDGECNARLLTRCGQIGRNPTLHNITFIEEQRVPDGEGTIGIGRMTAICRAITYEQ